MTLRESKITLKMCLIQLVILAWDFSGKADPETGPICRELFWDVILCNRNGETEKRGSQCKCSSWLSHHCVHLLDQSCWDLLRSRVDHASELNTSGTKREHLFPGSHSLLVRGCPWDANSLALPGCPL